MLNYEFYDLEGKDLEKLLESSKCLYELSIEDLKKEIDNGLSEGDIENFTNIEYNEESLFDLAQFVHNYSLIIMCDCVGILYEDTEDEIFNLHNEYEFEDYVEFTYGSEVCENLMTWSL